MNSPSAQSLFFPAFGCRSIAILLLAGVAGLSAQTPTPSVPGAQDVVVLSEFRVSTKPDNSYLATESTSGTRVATPIVNLPSSLQVLTEDFFKDFQLFDLDEQMPFVGGMAPGDENQGGDGGTRLRGFGVPYFGNGDGQLHRPLRDETQHRLQCECHQSLR